VLVQWNIFAQILAIACVLVPNIFDISQGFAGVVDQCTLKLKKKRTVRPQFFGRIGLSGVARQNSRLSQD
jgi:hypothetical protein